jgi:4a-hydroxytetrahydrobiopterin dehydratase
MSLADQKCTACRPGSPAVGAQELADFLAQYPNWRIVERSGVQQLECRFKFKNYAQAVAFTNQVAEIAEAEDHHPALLLEWGRVTVTWWTHTIQGLHRNDLIMAAKTERLYSAS